MTNEEPIDPEEIAVLHRQYMSFVGRDGSDAEVVAQTIDEYFANRRGWLYGLIKADVQEILMP